VVITLVADGRVRAQMLTAPDRLLHATGVDIPDRDDGRLTTIAKLASYIERGVPR